MTPEEFREFAKGKFSSCIPGPSNPGGGSGIIIDPIPIDGSSNAVASNGVFDALQLKANLDSPTFTGIVVLPSTTSIGTVSNLEISYLDGTTGNIQVQLNGKQPLLTWDSVPTDGSTNPVYSNGIFDALSTKQNTLVSGVNIKTINGQSLLGSGNITIAAGSSEIQRQRIAHFITDEVVTEFSTDLLADATVDQLEVYVDKQLLFNGLTDRISYNFNTTTITFNTSLPVGTEVQIFLGPESDDQPYEEPTATLPNYYGAKASSAAVTESEVLAGLFSGQNPIGTVTANWLSFNATPQYCWIAIPYLSSAYLKDTWNGSVLNNGVIPDGLFPTPADLTVAGQPYKIYKTAYATQFTEVIQFS